MGHKVNPLGLRLNLTRAWESVWYFGKKDYGKTFCEDLEIRKYLLKKLSKAAIRNIVIDRSAKKVTVNIYSAKLGLVIGKQGADIKDMKDYISAMVGLEVTINTYEVKNPDLMAELVAQSIAKQMEARLNYKRAMKRAMRAAMSTGALGIKICCGGRLGGAEIARKEWYREGSIPLHTLRANVDYGQATAFTTYGCCGIKVWICRPQAVEQSSSKPEPTLDMDQHTQSAFEVIGGTEQTQDNVKTDQTEADSSSSQEFFISPLSELRMRDMNKVSSQNKSSKSQSEKPAETKTEPKSSKTSKKSAEVDEKSTSTVDKARIDEENRTNTAASDKTTDKENTKKEAAKLSEMKKDE